MLRIANCKAQNHCTFRLIDFARANRYNDYIKQFGWIVAMKDMIYLPKSKILAVFMNVCAVLLFLFESDFLKKPLSEPPVLVTLCFCVAAFPVSMIRICISSEKMEIRIWGITVRRITADKIVRIEIIEWYNITRVVFETGKCPKFREDNWLELLDDFYLLNMFRTIEYRPPAAQEDTVIELLNSAFPGKVNVVEKDY